MKERSLEFIVFFCALSGSRQLTPLSDLIIYNDDTLVIERRRFSTNGLIRERGEQVPTYKRIGGANH